MRWWQGLVAALIVLVVIGITAIDGERETAGDYEREGPQSAAEVDEFAESCESVSASSVRLIESQLTVARGRITEAGAARSGELESVWLIATRIKGANFDELALFATDNLRRPRRVYAVDGAAEEAADWPVADGTNRSVEIQLGDEGTEEALECID